MNESDYTLTIQEAAEVLDKEPKTVYRYVKRGWLHPQFIKSSRGTLQYLFSKADLESLKTVDQSTLSRLDTQTSQDSQSTQDTVDIENKDEDVDLSLSLDRQPSQDRVDTVDRQTYQESIVAVLQEHVGFLREQIKVKDEQIKDLSKRNEVAIGIIGSFQKERMAIEAPKPEEPHHEYGYREHETDGSADAFPYE